MSTSTLRVGIGGSCCAKNGTAIKMTTPAMSRSRMVRKVYPLRPLDEIVGLIRRGCNALLAILPLGEMSANRTCEFHNVCANANLWLRGYSPTEVQTSLRVSDDERHDKVRSSLTAFV